MQMQLQIIATSVAFRFVDYKDLEQGYRIQLFSKILQNIMKGNSKNGKNKLLLS